MPDPKNLPLDHLRRLAQFAATNGDLDTHEIALRELARRFPKDPEPLLRLVGVLKARGDRDGALSVARQAVGAAPKDWRTHTVLASAFGTLGQLEPARKAYEAALAISPDQPSTLTAYGTVLERLRAVDEARAAGERAIARDPKFGPAACLLGQLETVAGDDEAAEKWFQRAVADSAQPDARSTAWHRIGALHEKRQEFDQAFEAHTRGNRVLLDTPAVQRALQAPILHQLPHQYLPESEAMLERWSERTFEGGPPDPVFLVGFPRSGTTLTEQVLGAIPGTITSDEEPVLTSTMRKALAMCGGPTPAELPARLDALTHDQLVELRAEYWRAVKMHVSPDAARAPMFVDKTPLRFIHLIYLNLLFPKGKVVFVVRDPRDCCLSCYFQDFAVNQMLSRFLTLEGTGDVYAQTLTFWLRARTRLTMPWLEVRYEDMVADFEPSARRLVEFLGCEWTDDILRFNEKVGDRAIRTPSYRAVTEQVNTRAVGKWTNYEKHLGPLIERISPLIDELGYAT